MPTETSYSEDEGHDEPSPVAAMALPQNVIEDGDYWYPAPGYQWENPDDPAASNYRVIPLNTVPTGDGDYVAAPGYCFANLQDFDDLSVVPVGEAPLGLANVVFDASCALVPAAGYRWAYSADPAASGFAVVPRSLDGEPVPGLANVVYDSAGNHQPAPGYDWVEPYDTGNYSVVPMTPGDPVPYLENVIYAAGGGFQPAPGYVWASADDPGDLRVVLAWTATADRDPALRTRLAIVDVPSPTGYRDPQQRQMQIALLSDAQLDSEIARMRRILEAMLKDFEGDTRAMEAWLGIARDAEMEALLESANLLGGGLIKLADQFGSLAAASGELAEQGIKATTYLLRAAELRETDPARAEQELKLAREILVDAYGKLHSLAPGLVAKAGGSGLEFLSFVVDYSYEVARWALAYEQIRSISDNLGRDNGKLEAQKAIQRLNEELIQERNRRRSQG